MKGKLESPFKNENPGPGNYNPRDSLSKDRIKSAIIKGSERFREKSRQDSPGPGNYYRDEYFARDVSPISMKGKGKDSINNANPGPGSYDPTLLAVRDAIRNIKLSSSQRP